MIAPLWFATLTWASEYPPSMHDLSEAIPATTVLYVVIVLLGSLSVWLIVRDRNSIATSLDGLTTEFGKFREELAKNYATKADVKDVWAGISELDKKIERVRDHTLERRMVSDAEGR